MQVERLFALLGACALLWAVESRWPLFVFGASRTRHIVPNLVLTALTVVMNLGFTWSLGSPQLARGLWPNASPFWLQAVAGVAVLDLCAWLAHLLLHKTTWGWRAHRYITPTLP